MRRDKLLDYFRTLDFTASQINDEVKQILKFSHLHGNKENEFCLILGNFLQRLLLCEQSSNFFVVLNSPLPYLDRLKMFTEPRQVSSYEKLKSLDDDHEIINKMFAKHPNKPPSADITIYNEKGHPSHSIEVKVNRRGHFLDTEDMEDETELKNVDSILSDLKLSCASQVLFEDTTFWQGIITYSFHPIGKQFPPNFPKYWDRNEKNANVARTLELDLRLEEHQDIWFSRCLDERKRFGKKLARLLDKQSAYLQNPVKRELLVIPIVEKGVVEFTLETDDAAQKVLVQSEMFLFEVNAQQDYLASLLPKIAQHANSSFQ